MNFNIINFVILLTFFLFTILFYFYYKIETLNICILCCNEVKYMYVYFYNFIIF